LRWERVWYSTSRYRGPLGHGWHHGYDAGLLLVGDQAVAVRTADGREQAFLPLKVGEEHHDRKEKNTLVRDAQGYALRMPDGLIHRFGEVIPGEAQKLVRIEDGAGNQLRFSYDRRGRLSEIVDSCGRELTVTTDGEGRIVQIAGPHPMDPLRRQTLVDYAYDGHGNLAEARDALGQPIQFQYRKHLLVKETNRNGLSFHFEYDGETERARCIRTWGDGGIYDHQLRYEQGFTVVTNSLGHATTYFHFGGLVHKTVDPLGGVTLTERNGMNDLVRETDALGRTTEYKHDDRGNVARVRSPGGATLRMKYDARDRLTAAEDALGGAWRWRYDQQGRLLERQDPLGRRTLFEYSGKHLHAVVDPAEHRTWLSYGPDGLLAGVRTPDGAETRWEYDRLGRCTAATDPKGNVQRREHDPLGRVVRIHEPDGNTRDLSYDPEGNIIHARDRQHDVHFRYTGMGRMTARTEAGTTVEFLHDAEEQLVAVKNEHGFAYRFTLGPTGQVDEELGFDDTRRRYHRDLAG
ncbi:MAG TPA: DUF6531 domain-containing protein, partial [Propionibacteriaceae bacterium]|nr:DUF6531 domain-containing protein [Propionibacteriaceae bacterium]